MTEGALLIVSFFVGLGGMVIWLRSRRPNPVTGRNQTRPKHLQTLSLQRQLDLLEGVGIALAPGVTPDDLLTAFPEEEYEMDPIQLLLMTLGSEPTGIGPGSQDVFRLDDESVDDPASYAGILRDLAEIAGVADQITGIASDVDFQHGQAHLSYRFGETSRALSPKVEGAWVDPGTIDQIIADLETLLPERRRFWCVPDGQAMLLCVLSDGGAKQLNSYHRELLHPAVGW